ncbi:MAG: hypothetical protein K0U98_01305 [Deltaproteobacteria bacterium]|nr:hypothetical protein [Deltaproteobacteria bacterium]
MALENAPNARDAMIGFLFLAGFVLLLNPVSAGIVPTGPELAVNVTTPGNQFGPDVAPTPDGGFIVAWVHTRSEEDRIVEFFFRPYGADGTPLSSEISSGATVERGGGVDIATDGEGNFVLAFSIQNQILGFFHDLYFKPFNADGTAAGETEIATIRFQEDNSLGGVAMTPMGSFILAWNGCCEGPDWGVSTRFVDSSGTPEPEPVFQVDRISRPDVAAAPDGGFFLAWRQDGLQGQWLTDRGSAVGSPIPLISAPVTGLSTPVARFQPDGTGLALLSSRTPGFVEILGRRVSRQGVPLGTEFPVMSPPIASGSNFYLDAAVLHNGEFVAVWQRELDGGIPGPFMARHFSREGQPLSTPISLDLPTFSEEIGPHVAAIGIDSLVLTWLNTDGRDGSDSGIFAQRYDITRDSIFADGFESGDLSAWPLSVP